MKGRLQSHKGDRTEPMVERTTVAGSLEGAGKPDGEVEHGICNPRTEDMVRGPGEPDWVTPEGFMGKEMRSSAVS